MPPSDFIQKQWFEQIQEGVQARSKFCGPDQIYNYREQNPFISKNVDAFKVSNPVKKSRCMSPTVAPMLDKYKRYYKNAQFQKSCPSTGVWDPASNNRTTRFGKGVCWASEEEKECGRLTPNELIMPYPENKLNTAKRQSLKTAAAATCDKVKSCKWEDSRGCMTKKAHSSQHISYAIDPPDSMPPDITQNSSEIQKYLHDWYVKGKHGHAPLTRPLDDKSGCKQDGPVDHKLSIPQSVLNMLLKNLSRSKSTNRGMLAWHSTGSGKLCAATSVIDAFWDDPRQIVFASSIDAIASNPPFKFHECARNLFPRFKNMSMEEIEQAFDKRQVIYKTFARLANAVKKTEALKKQISKSNKKRGGSLKDRIEAKILQDFPDADLKSKPTSLRSLEDYINLDNTILIIDEVHNLFRPLPNQVAQHKYVEEKLTTNANLKVVILTATPGDNVQDTMKLLNIVRDPTHPLITPPSPDDPGSIEAFKESIRGMVSYFDMSSDRSKFPVVIDNGPIKLPMSRTQFDKYVEAYKEVKPSFQDYEKLEKQNKLSTFWQGARKYSNMLYNFEKGLSLTEFSSKLPALLETIAKYPNEKHYIYSAFSQKHQGVQVIAEQLEASGYKKLTVAEARKINNSANELPPQRRYVLALQSDLSPSASKTATGKNLSELVQQFNAPANKTGAFVHVFLASQGFNEALDLKGVQHIHIFEPLVTAAADYQTIGRARRYCSHADLDQNQWTVNIHRYFSDFPVDFEVHNFEALENEVTNLTNKLTDLEKTRTETKDKTIKKELKASIEESKVQLRDLKAKIKQSKKEDVQNIDDFIAQTAKDQMRKLFVIHHAIKEAAVDCRLLHRFHGDSTVKCST